MLMVLVVVVVVVVVVCSRRAQRPCKQLIAHVIMALIMAHTFASRHAESAWEHSAPRATLGCSRELAACD